jgi:hypothetical protein
MFNVPAVVLSTIALLVLIEAGREWLLTDEENNTFLLYFGFIPAVSVPKSGPFSPMRCFMPASSMSA